VYEIGFELAHRLQDTGHVPPKQQIVAQVGIERETATAAA
jgi:hypothetical protein